MNMTTLNISLPDEMRSFIESQIALEGFASASEYLGALVREAQRRKAKQELETKLLEGLQSPAAEMSVEDWSALRQRIVDRSPDLQDRG